MRRQDSLEKRIKRCAGHLESVGRMIGSGRTCEEVLVQLAAVRSAVNQISALVYEKHLDECVRRGGSGKHSIRELKVISRMLLSGKIG